MEKQEAPIDNTPFSEEEIEHFKDRLREEEKEAEEKINTFQERISEIEQKLDDTSSSSAHHQGNIGSSEEEREKYYAMIEKQKEKIEKISAAKDRIETGNYGICNVTGDPISKERLEIMPYAEYSAEAVKSANNVEPQNMSVRETQS